MLFVELCIVNHIYWFPAKEEDFGSIDPLFSVCPVAVEKSVVILLLFFFSGDFRIFPLHLVVWNFMVNMTVYGFLYVLCWTLSGHCMVPLLCLHSWKLLHIFSLIIPSPLFFLFSFELQFGSFCAFKVDSLFSFFYHLCSILGFLILCLVFCLALLLRDFFNLFNSSIEFLILAILF